MLGQREKSNTIKAKDTTRIDKSEGIGEERKTKKIPRYRQDGTFQNNERKFHQLVEGECTKTYQQPDARGVKI